MRRQSPIIKILSAAILVVALIFFLFPVVWMVLTSFKTNSEFFSYLLN